MVEPGFCQCGCGRPTRIARTTSSVSVAGQMAKFVRGHRPLKASIVGYRRERSNGRNLGAHKLVVERAMGKPLPRGAVVHHIDEDKTNNAHSNLVVCQGHAYHMLLHRRARALRECGHADWRWCVLCKTFDAPENLYIRPLRRAGWDGDRVVHPKCQNEKRRRQRAAKKAGA